MSILQAAELNGGELHEAYKRSPAAESASLQTASSIHLSTAQQQIPTDLMLWVIRSGKHGHEVAKASPVVNGEALKHASVRVLTPTTCVWPFMRTNDQLEVVQLHERLHMVSNNLNLGLVL